MDEGGCSLIHLLWSHLAQELVNDEISWHVIFFFSAAVKDAFCRVGYESLINVKSLHSRGLQYQQAMRCT